MGASARTGEESEQDDANVRAADGWTRRLFIARFSALTAGAGLTTALPGVAWAEPATPSPVEVDV